MKTIIVKTENKVYPIYLGKNFLSKIGGFCLKHRFGKKILIITNPKPSRYYLSQVISSLKQEDFRVFVRVLSAGEVYKNLATVQSIYQNLIQHEFHRDDQILALGGGVIGDLAGFAAATFLRGIRYVQIPTTLMGQVDSSIGGKTGVNLSSGKNLIGAYHHPEFVLSDTATLKTLSKREILNGMAEVVKYAIIWDKRFFAQLKASFDAWITGDLSQTERFVERCIQIKATVVIADERESKLRSILNYGHTFGHAIESLGHYRGLTHGEAIAIGMQMAGKTAFLYGMFSRQELELQNSLLRPLSPTSKPRLSGSILMAKMRLDKKVKADQIRLILPRRIGQVKVVAQCPLALIEKGIETYQEN